MVKPKERRDGLHRKWRVRERRGSASAACERDRAGGCGNISVTTRYYARSRDGAMGYWPAPRTAPLLPVHDEDLLDRLLAEAQLRRLFAAVLHPLLRGPGRGLMAAEP